MAHILVIDDEDSVRSAIQTALQIMGHNVDVASDGMEGVDACDRSKFDLVITDMVMPRKDGVETILELKLNQPEIKIIAVSGSDEAVDIMETTYALGADRAMTKPFSFQDLQCQVTDLLGASNAR